MMQPKFVMSSSLAVSHGAKMLIHGPAGMGKTMLMATLPRPMILSAESGLLSLSKANIERVFGVNTPGISYDIPVWQIRSLSDLFEAFEWASKDASAGNFQSIALDSITEIAEEVLRVEKVKAKDPRQAYGELITIVVSLIKGFRDLPGKHVAMLAKQGSIETASGIKKLGAMMPGSKLEQEIPYLFDEVFALTQVADATDARKTHRVLQTQPDIQIDAKDRSGSLAPLEHPNLAHIIRKLTGV